MHDLYNFITNYRGIYHVDTKYIKIFMIYSLIYLYFMIIMCNMYLFIFENYLVFFLPHFVILYIHTYTCIYNLHEAKLLFLKHIYKKIVY